jgi:uncharacterized membrane protein YfcA
VTVPLFATDLLVGLSPAALALALAIVAIGAVVQGSIGFGLGLLAAPVLGVIDPDFLPVSIVVAVIPLGVGVVFRDRAHIVWGEVGYALTGRLPGVVVGAWLVGALGQRAVTVAIAVSVLLAVVGSVTRVRFMPTRRNLVLAGVASGITGTAAGIGGPPMALTYQHSDPAALRSTLAAYFTVGAAMSFAALAVGGSVGVRELELSALLLPGTLAGLAVSRFTVRHLPAATLRPVILVVCSASALVLLVETFTVH